MPDASALATASLERLAGERGDITSDVVGLYYARFPRARESFERHGCGNRGELEGRMVAATVFLLLHWIEEPVSARIEQGTTIPHHNDTLEIHPHWYLGLIDAVLVVLLDTIPPDCREERALWLRVRGEIADYFDSLRPEFWRDIDASPLPAFAQERADWA